MSRVQPLFALQQADSRIDTQNSNLSRIEATLTDTSMLEAARQEVAEAEAALRRARSAQKELEFESETSEKHAADLEKKLYGGQIKGNKEMQSAQQEIETFRKRHRELDDKSVEAMIETEEAEKNLAAARKKLAEVETTWETTAAALRQERDKLQAELPGLKTEREKLAKNVMSADLPLYERLRSQKQGVAVAEILMGKFCGKCRVELPLAKQTELRKPMALVNCPSCGRILYQRL